MFLRLTSRISSSVLASLRFLLAICDRMIAIRFHFFDEAFGFLARLAYPLIPGAFSLDELDIVDNNNARHACPFWPMNER